MTGPAGATAPWSDPVGGTIGAAVLVIDTVGSTERRVRLGEALAEVARRADYAAIESAVEHHDGTVYEWRGDGVLALFPGPSAALAAANSLADSSYRIGVSVGDVHRFDDDRWHGPAITTANRLEEQCPAGGVALCPLTTAALPARPDRASAMTFAVEDRLLDGLVILP